MLFMTLKISSFFVFYEVKLLNSPLFEIVHCSNNFLEPTLSHPKNKGICKKNKAILLQFVRILSTYKRWLPLAFDLEAQLD